MGEVLQRKEWKRNDMIGCSKLICKLKTKEEKRLKGSAGFEAIEI
jgi:hypothetical protein